MLGVTIVVKVSIQVESEYNLCCRNGGGWCSPATVGVANCVTINAESESAMSDENQFTDGLGLATRTTAEAIKQENYSTPNT